MRPEILFPLFAPVTRLKGVGPKLAPLVARVAGETVRDVIFRTPQGLVERVRAPLSEAVEGSHQIFEGIVESHLPPRRAGQPYRIRLSDGGGAIVLAWFRSAGARLEELHPVGARRVASGRIERYGLELQIAHPDYLLPPERADEIPLREPVYALTAGLAGRTYRRVVADALSRVPDLPEWRPDALVRESASMAWREAVLAIHAPHSEADLSPDAPARLRLASDEILAHQIALARRKARRRARPAPPLGASALAGAVESGLPFRLTPAQQRALGDLRADLASGQRMNRLLHGDVGSGKTVVAMLAMADAAAVGRQAVLMAPTEILARQHYETLRGPLGAAGVSVVLLTGRDRGAARQTRLDALRGGEAAVAVGTHALFQDDVAFADLALAVIDEQHRFGVDERRRLLAKGASVHALAMSATPIPRTLELTLYGDLDVSRLDEKPPGRTPVATRAVPTPRMDEVVARLRAAVDAGSQAFWICPLIGESEASDLAAAESRADALRAVLGARVGLVHGRMNAAERDEVMAAFAGGALSVLVATTVIEVGVDVPNASIMVIEQAERFGLSQLHQLRGRVGRGAKASSCLLLYDPPLSDVAQARLDVLRRTDEGFVIAERDLELRGGGDPLGLKQSGFPDYRFADPWAHRRLFAPAAEAARAIVADRSGVEASSTALLEALFDWRADGPISDAG